MRVFTRDASVGRKVFEAFLAVLIIALLAAIFWPPFTGTHGSPRSACLSRIKQLTMGAILYASDNGDTVPPFYTFDNNDGDFIRTTKVYIKNEDVYWCPEVKVDPRADMKPIQYAHSLSLQKEIEGYKAGQRTLKVSYNSSNAAKIPYLRDIIRSSEIEQGITKYLSPHGDRFSVCYLDGHAKSILSLSEANGL